jgi:GNAT superfamily N-acetyltransferase
MQFEITDTPAAADHDVVAKSLTAFNTGEVGPPERRTLCVFIRDNGGKVVGGSSGFTQWGWLFTQLLWISEEMRGQGLAGTLLQHAEDEARRRGCKGAWIDTFSPHAKHAYERQGYAVFGEIPDFVAGRSRYFLQKRLD